MTPRRSTSAGMQLVGKRWDEATVLKAALYNAATGWSRILRSHMRLFAVVLSVIGIVIAATRTA